ncbi:MAG: group III truncated hemoglobin [Rhodothermales bacterium]|nr:group III truncated hemoglobin [Rhodothermales bacterium]
MSDILSRADIVLLVDSFYVKVRADEMLGRIFDKVAKVDWNSHLPKMYDFWETTLLNRPGYKGNPVKVHQRINDLTPLDHPAFQRWLQLFDKTVDELFSGPQAEDIKVRALSIATILEAKLSTGGEIPIVP